jgi:PKD repeat protein
MRHSTTAVAAVALATIAALTAWADTLPGTSPPGIAAQQRLARRAAPGRVPGLHPPVRPQGLEVRDLLAVAGPYWAKAFGAATSDSAGLVRRTASSNLVFAGTFGDLISGTSDLWILTVDSSGNRVWEKVYGTPGGDFGAIFAASGGGYALYAESYDDQFNVVAFTLAKLDANGTVLWQKQLLKDGVPTDVLDFASPLADGGFLLSGSTSTLVFPPTYLDLLIRISSSGSIVWQKQYPRPSTDTLSSFGVQELADTSLLQTGSKFPAPTGFQNTDAWFRKLSSSGAVLLDKYIGGPEADGLYSVMPANGGGFIAIGTTKSWVQPGDVYGNIWIVKLDANFNIVAQKSFGDAGAESGSLAALSDGYLLSGTVRGVSAPIAGGASAAAIDTAGDAFVVKLDNNLNQVWGKTYNAGGAESGYAAPDSSGGGFLMSGSTDGAGHGGNDIMLAKLDADGNVVWARAYGGNNTDTGYGFRVGGFPVSASEAQLLAPADSDILLAGATLSFGAGSSDVLAATLDSNGQITGCPFVQSISLTATPWTIPVITTTATVVTNSPTASDITSFTSANGTLTTSTRTSTVSDACNATPALTVTAAADTTSGTAPLTVNFTGTAANGTQPYTWEWDFGDGSAKSTQQNPSHTYNDPGSYAVTLKVTDSAAKTASDTHLTIDVAGTCTIFCYSNVPASGTVGQSITFQGTAEWANCTGSPTYAWTFGDGQTSSTQSPTHTYAGPGTYDWVLTVSQDGQSCTKNGTLTITGAAAATTLWVPSIAHAPGAGSSKWRSNIAVVNRSGGAANLTLDFVPYASGATVTKTHTLANGATVEWADVLVSLFGFADSANTKGTVKVTSDRAIVALSRTYNQAASGTFGQYYPALPASQSITGAQAAVLPLLKKNAAFRTNVGFQNLTGSSCSGEVKLFNATGAQVGTTRTLTAAADKYVQEDDVFTKAGAGNQDVAYARVQVTTAGCKAWFYGSVIDAVTNDPTTVPQQTSAAGPYWVPSVAHAPGAGTSKWRTNIAVVNRSGASATLTLEFIPYAAGATVTKTQTLANNTTVEWADVLVSLFGFADSANTKGTVKITSDKSIFALSRTYNQAASGTFGQYYPALVAAQSVTSGQSAVLPLLKKSSDFRTNAGFQNLGAASCTGTIKLYNATGVQVGSTRTLTAATDKYIQDDDVFAKAGAGNQQPAYAVVEVTTAGGKAWFFGSVIDAITNDPTTVPQQQ